MSKRLQVRIISVIALLMCLSIVWAVYKTSFPAQSPEEGVIGALMAILYCLPIILVNGFVKNYYHKNFPEDFNEPD